MWVLLLLISLVSALTIGYVIWPLVRRPPVQHAATGEELAELMTRKDAALQAVRDLAFDHSVGKIEDADFERFNRLLRQRALGLMHQIEQHDPGTFQFEEALEEEIAGSRRVGETPRDEGRGRIREE